MRMPLVALLIATAIAACTTVAPGPGSASSGKAAEQARAALDHWAAAAAKLGPGALVVPVGDLTGQIGDWEPANGDNKAALLAGLVFTNAELVGPAQQGELTWTGGSTTSVPVMSAQDGIVAIENAAKASGGSCEGCQPLTATKATLIAGSIDTTRGPATGPIWSFAIEGTAVQLTRVAIANALVVPPLPGDPSFSLVGLHLDSGTGSMTGTEVTVSFVGAPDPGSEPCGEDYTATAVESDLAVVVIVVRGPSGFTVGGCSAVGATRTATATLKAPLGARAVLNVDTGQPVPMTVLP